MFVRVESKLFFPHQARMNFNKDLKYFWELVLWFNNSVMPQTWSGIGKEKRSYIKRKKPEKAPI